MRVGIIGIGGVGGYFGGMLAKHYSNSHEVEIIFIARGSTKHAIKKNGLKLFTNDETSIISPSIVSNSPLEIGELDLLICCVKGFSLEESLLSIKECITSKTFILPLLNGVDSTARIVKLFPINTVLNGCVYIVSRVIEPGMIQQTGAIHKLFFGSNDIKTENLKSIEQLFIHAQIETYLTDDIEKVVWEKYLFVSSIATLTSHLNLSIGKILENETHRKTLEQLLTEVSNVGIKKGIDFPKNIVGSTLKKMESLPFKTTSSMHYDFQNGNKTELKTLTEYVSQTGKELGVDTTTYNEIFAHLSKTSIERT